MSIPVIKEIQTSQTIGLWHFTIGFLAIGNRKVKGNRTILNRRISYKNSVWHILLSLWIQNRRNPMSAIFLDCKIVKFIMHRIACTKSVPGTGIGSTKEGTKPTTHPQILIYMIVEWSWIDDYLMLWKRYHTIDYRFLSPPFYISFCYIHLLMPWSTCHK